MELELSGIPLRENLEELVYKAFKQSILSGKLAPGTRLIEEEIAKAMRVSKTPVRHALARLQSEGLVVAIPWQGKRVVSLTLEEVSQLYDVREALEGMAARLAAGQLGEEVLAQMTAHVADSERHLAQGDMEAFLVADRSWHDLLIRGSGNDLLAQMMEGVRNKILIMQVASIYYGRRGQDSVAEHRSVLEALYAHDSDAAEQRMRAHICNVRAIVLKTLAKN